MCTPTPNLIHGFFDLMVHTIVFFTCHLDRLSRFCKAYQCASIHTDTQTHRHTDHETRDAFNVAHSNAMGPKTEASLLPENVW